MKANMDVEDEITEEVKACLKAGLEKGVFTKNKAGLFKVQKPKPAPKPKKEKAPKKPAGAKKGKGGRKGKKKVNLKNFRSLILF